MERRFVSSVFAAVGLAALIGSRVGLAAAQTPPGTISTVAGTGQAGFSGDGGPAIQARLSLPFSLAIDATGSLFVSDGNNQRVRLYWPRGLAVDTAGNLFIADHLNHLIRKVSPEGIITTVAGSGRDDPTKGVSVGDDGGQRYAGDAVLATATGLRGPIGLAVDAVGDLLFTDSAQRNAQGPNERVLIVFGVAAPGLIADEPLPRL